MQLLHGRLIKLNYVYSNISLQSRGRNLSLMQPKSFISPNPLFRGSLKTSNGNWAKRFLCAAAKNHPH